MFIPEVTRVNKLARACSQCGSQRVLTSGRLQRKRRSREMAQRDGGKRSDPTLLALNMEEGGHESRNTAASKSWKGQGNSLP